MQPFYQNDFAIRIVFKLFWDYTNTKHFVPRVVRMGRRTNYLETGLSREIWDWLQVCVYKILSRNKFAQSLPSRRHLVRLSTTHGAYIRIHVLFKKTTLFSSHLNRRPVVTPPMSLTTSTL